jgi:hypothetical protein
MTALSTAADADTRPAARFDALLDVAARNPSADRYTL